MCAEEREKLDELTDFYHQVLVAVHDVDRTAMDDRVMKRIENLASCPFCKLELSIYKESRWMSKSKGRSENIWLDFGGSTLVTRERIEDGIKLLTGLLEHCPEPGTKYIRDPKDGTWKVYSR